MIIRLLRLGPSLRWGDTVATACVSDGYNFNTNCQQTLKKRHETLNPFVLKRIIDQKVRHILHLASVTSSVSQRS